MDLGLDTDVASSLMLISIIVGFIMPVRDSVSLDLSSASIYG